MAICFRIRRRIGSAFLVPVLLYFLAGAAAQKQREQPANKAELAGISQRGQALAAYDNAAWHATDAVMAVAPNQERPEWRYYIARKTGSLWEVMFGRFNEAHDKFLILYEAQQGASATDFTVKKHDPPREVGGFYLFAARALAMAQEDFKGENRTYNVAVLPAKTNQFFVYVLPAQTDKDVFPLGGDMRYLISADGSRILERHRMHNDIIEFKGTDPVDTHAALVDEVPEDTDIFLTMRRKLPHWVATRHFVYIIFPTGETKYVMPFETWVNLGNKKPEEAPK